MVVPGSAQVSAQAEAEGLDELFRAAGFDWRSAGCSMCLGMNPDILAPGERCASTSNRNFEGRQGRGGRTHLVSPEMAAAAAIEGHFVDIRTWELSMEPITTIAGAVSDLDRADVDTDQIIPKQFLKRIERTGFGEFLFFDWAKEPGWELPRNPILTAGRNFGCGSSREHAPWALEDYGFRAIVAPSFGDIFYNNCAKIGLLAVVLDEADVRALAAAGEGEVDLEAQEVRFAGRAVPFEIDAEIRRRLLGGLDDIALTLGDERSIAAYEAERERAGPLHLVALTTARAPQLHQHTRCSLRSKFTVFRSEEAPVMRRQMLGIVGAAVARGARRSREARSRAPATAPSLQTYPVATALCVRARTPARLARSEARAPTRRRWSRPATRWRTPFGPLVSTVDAAEATLLNTVSAQKLLVATACPRPVPATEQAACQAARATAHSDRRARRGPRSRPRWRHSTPRSRPTAPPSGRRSCRCAAVRAERTGASSPPRARAARSGAAARRRRRAATVPDR